MCFGHRRVRFGMQVQIAHIFQIQKKSFMAHLMKQGLQAKKESARGAL
jgi:hypothetical protein